MLPRDELLESIDILVQHAVKETTQIYTALVTAVDDNSCTIRVNGKSHSGIVYYGEIPTVNKSYRVFAPNGSMNQAFIITGGSGGLTSLPIASDTQLGAIKVGAGLAISDSGTLSATGGGTADSVDWKNVQDKPTTISGYGITDVKISGNTIILGNGTMTPYTGNNPPPYPVTSVNGQTGDITIDTGGNVDSVNGKTGDVVLDASDVGALPSTTVIPSKTSQLTNDSGYVNQTQAKNAAPVQSVDGATGAVVTNAVKTTVQSLTDTQKHQARENIGAGTSSFDGDYNSLSNKPTIPTKVSQLENDSDYATESQVDAKYTKPTSGIPKSDLSSDVQTSLNKADTALQSAPVTSVNNKTGDVQLTATDVGALPDTTKIPSKTSDITNDSGYITEADVPTKTSELANDSGFITSVDVLVKSVNSKIGDVQLNASDVGALPSTTVIPSKTSELDNDSGFITEIPVASKAQLGGVKIGAGLTVSSEGTISVSGGGTADAVEWKNVLDKPTTIDGYGITDAKIDNGTITLGNQSVTPLTEAPVTSVNEKTGDVVLSATDVGAVPIPENITANTWLKTDANKNFVLSSLPNASTGARGITYLVNSYVRTDTDKAVTPKALNDVYKLIPEVTQILGNATDKVPSEKAVSDALQNAGTGDMLKSVYDANSDVESVGGISAFVADTITNKVGDGNITIILNGNKVDTFNVNTKEDKNIKLNINADDVGLGNVIDEPQYCDSNQPPYPVTSVNGKTGDVVIDVSGGGTQVKIVRW